MDQLMETTGPGKTTGMNEGVTILIADRNSHVREYLKREMLAEGYRVILAQNGRQVLNYSYDASPLDLLIIDLDLPDMDAAVLMERLTDRIPALPMIIHGFATDSIPLAEQSDAMVFVEKEGGSIESIKHAVCKLLKTPHSPGFKRNKEIMADAESGQNH